MLLNSGKTVVIFLHVKTMWLCFRLQLTGRSSEENKKNLCLAGDTKYLILFPEVLQLSGKYSKAWNLRKSKVDKADLVFKTF